MTFEYAPAPESKSIVKIQPQYGHFINGDFIKGKNHFPTINPATEEVLSQISLGGKVELDKAVTAATKAFTKWSKLTGAERGKYLYRIARILQERAREFAVLETMAPPTTTTTAMTAMMRLRVPRRWAASARRAACRSALARATSRLRLLDVTVALLLGCLHTDA